MWMIQFILFEYSFQFVSFFLPSAILLAFPLLMGILSYLLMCYCTTIKLFYLYNMIWAVVSKTQLTKICSLSGLKFSSLITDYLNVTEDMWRSILWAKLWKYMYAILRPFSIISWFILIKSLSQLVEALQGPTSHWLQFIFSNLSFKPLISDLWPHRYRFCEITSILCHEAVASQWA